MALPDETTLHAIDLQNVLDELESSFPGLTGTLSKTEAEQRASTSSATAVYGRLARYIEQASGSQVMSVALIHSDVKWMRDLISSSTYYADNYVGD